MIKRLDPPTLSAMCQEVWTSDWAQRELDEAFEIASRGQYRSQLQMRAMWEAGEDALVMAIYEPARDLYSFRKLNGSDIPWASGSRGIGQFLQGWMTGLLTFHFFARAHQRGGYA